MEARNLSEQDEVDIGDVSKKEKKERSRAILRSSSKLSAESLKGTKWGRKAELNRKERIEWGT